MDEVLSLFYMVADLDLGLKGQKLKKFEINQNFYWIQNIMLHSYYVILKWSEEKMCTWEISVADCLDRYCKNRQQ